MLYVTLRGPRSPCSLCSELVAIVNVGQLSAEGLEGFVNEISSFTQNLPPQGCVQIPFTVA